MDNPRPYTPSRSQSSGDAPLLATHSIKQTASDPVNAVSPSQSRDAARDALFEGHAADKHDGAASSGRLDNQKPEDDTNIAPPIASGTSREAFAQLHPSGSNRQSETVAYTAAAAARERSLDKHGRFEAEFDPMHALPSDPRHSRRQHSSRACRKQHPKRSRPQSRPPRALSMPSSQSCRHPAQRKRARARSPMPSASRTRHERQPRRTRRHCRKRRRLDSLLPLQQLRRSPPSLARSPPSCAAATTLPTLPRHSCSVAREGRAAS